MVKKNTYISSLIYRLIFIKVKYWSEDDFNNTEVQCTKRQKQAC